MPRTQEQEELIRNANTLDEVVFLANDILGLQETTRIVDEAVDHDENDEFIIDILRDRIDIVLDNESADQSILENVVIVNTDNRSIVEPTHNTDGSFMWRTLERDMDFVNPPPQEYHQPDVSGIYAQIRNTTRGGRRTVEGTRTIQEGEMRIPRIIEELEEKMSKHSNPKASVKKLKVDEKIKHIYPEDGYLHISGYRFSRKPTYTEDQYFRNYGFHETIKKFSDLLYKEKERPINEEEEVIITLCEVADFYATDECNRTIENFNIKIHNEDYQKAYKKHLKSINGFKRNKNG